MQKSQFLWETITTYNRNQGTEPILLLLALCALGANEKYVLHQPNCSLTLGWKQIAVTKSICWKQQRHSDLEMCHNLQKWESIKIMEQWFNAKRSLRYKNNNYYFTTSLSYPLKKTKESNSERRKEERNKRSIRCQVTHLTTFLFSQFSSNYILSNIITVNIINTTPITTKHFHCLTVKFIKVSQIIKTKIIAPLNNKLCLMHPG